MLGAGPLLERTTCAAADHAAQRGARFLVVLAHVPERAGQAPDRRERAVVAALEEAGLEVLDTQPLLPAERVTALYLPDGHWTPEGHRIVARALLERLGE